MLVVVCGVSGCGKSTIGAGLAAALGFGFYDADDFHPDANKAKLSAGLPLSDADRAPWLADMASRIAGWKEAGGTVLACSALKEAYRRALLAQYDGPVHWVVLHGAEPLLRQRLEARQGHFADAGILASQLAIFEAPEYGQSVDIAQSPDEIIAQVAAIIRG